MDQEIALIESKTFWVSAAGFLLSIASLFGLHVGGVNVNILGGHLYDIATGVLFIATIVGRIVAQKRVTSILKK
ncbi:MAG: hypothetical protein WCA63_00800 [Gallionella sp.]